MADLLTLTLFLVTLSIPIAAGDLGVHGKLFPVEEQDLILYLKKQVDRLPPEERERAIQRIEEHCAGELVKPAGMGLKRAQFYEVRYFDPTILATEDFTDHKGNIVVPKGTLYNPLEHHHLSQELLFVDGDEASHVAWARDQDPDAKWVLTDGHPLALEEQECRPIYFDQYGALVKKLSIRSIPARVSQEGKRLKIELIPMEVPCLD